MKLGRTSAGGWVILVIVGSVIGGCGPDLKEKVAMLEDSRRALTDELNRVQNALANADDELNTCRRDLASARDETSALRGQMARQPTGEVPEGWTAVPGGAMIPIEGWALFDSGKATIKKPSVKVLDLIASTLKSEYPTKDVLVFGHTDDVPIKVSGWKDNLELSSQRALSVVRYLASQGVEQRRLVACGCGEHRPRVPNESDRARQKNRRVEIFVLEPQTHTGTH